MKGVYIEVPDGLKAKMKAWLKSNGRTWHGWFSEQCQKALIGTKTDDKASGLLLAAQEAYRVLEMDYAAPETTRVRTMLLDAINKSIGAKS